MDAKSGFTVGREVGRFGRWFRLIIGLYFTLFLTVVPLIRDPVSPNETLSFLVELGGYLLLVTGVYLLGFYLLSERVLARANPWVGTLIFLGPLAVVSVMALGPTAFRVALGVYVNLSLVVNFLISYGGCEVLALPTLIFRRRYTVYCPYNAVDAVENALTIQAPGQQGFAWFAMAITLLLGSYYILLELMDLENVIGIESDPRLSSLFLVPVAFLVRSAWLAGRDADPPDNSAARSLWIGAVVLALLTAILFFRLAWEPFWGLAMLLGGLYALLKLFSGRGKMSAESAN